MKQESAYEQAEQEYRDWCRVHGEPAMICPYCGCDTHSRDGMCSGCKSDAREDGSRKTGVSE